MNDWKEAVIDQLVVYHIYNKTHDDNPRKAINDLLQIVQDIALDPKVSDEARKLLYTAPNGFTLEEKKSNVFYLKDYRA